MTRSLCPRRLPTCFAMLMLLASSSGCRRAELSGPPNLRVGRDLCVECGMIISEERCCSAMLIEAGPGNRREHVLFDDIGCMLDYEHAEPEGVRIVEAFVRDHSTKQWAPAGDAFFLFADRERLPTPMGSGIVAFATAESAAAARNEFEGQVMDYARLAAARREWMEARYGKPEGRP